MSAAASRYKKAGLATTDLITDPFGWKRDEREKAATKVQKIARGKFARRHVAAMSKSKTQVRPLRTTGR